MKTTDKNCRVRDGNDDPYSLELSALSLLIGQVVLNDLTSAIGMIQDGDVDGEVGGKVGTTSD